MPVVIKKNYKDYTIAIWKIEEEESYFYQKIEFSEYDTKELGEISHPAKRLEWLASRYLIKFIMDKPSIIYLNKKANGKPIIENFPCYISITHTSGYAAVIYSEKAEVSIDAEKIASRVEKIERKFLSEIELSSIHKEDKIEYLIIYWSIKETIFKLLEIPRLNFAQEIYIQPFSKKDGIAKVLVKHAGIEKEFSVNFRKLSQVYTTWCLGGN